MERASIRIVLLLILATLALATQLPLVTRGSQAASTPEPAHPGSRETTAFTGVLPPTFSLTGVLKGQAEEPGLDLPGKTRMRVNGDAVRAGPLARNGSERTRGSKERAR